MAITNTNLPVIDRLKELQKLYESGILSKEEMETEKAEILADKTVSASTLTNTVLEDHAANNTTTCPVCGEQIEKGLKVCPLCNEKIAGNNTPEPTGKARNSNWMWIVVGLCVIAIIGVAITVGNNENNEQNETAKEASTNVVSENYQDDHTIEESNVYSGEADNGEANDIVKKNIKERVEAIYDYGINYSEKAAMALYFTESLYNLYNLSTKSVPDGEIAYPNYNIWTQSQDPYQPQINVIRVTLIDETLAGVSLTIKDGKNLMGVYLTMTKVNDDWYIDDMKSVSGEVDGVENNFRENLTLQLRGEL